MQVLAYDKRNHWVFTMLLAFGTSNDSRMDVELSSMAKNEETTPWLQVALQILFSQEVRKDPFVLMSAGVSIFFGLKKLHKVIKFLCCEKKWGYSGLR